MSCWRVPISQQSARRLFKSYRALFRQFIAADLRCAGCVADRGWPTAARAQHFQSPGADREVIQGYSGAAQAKGLQLFALIDSTVPEWLGGDITRIRQILNNLLNNALKFTDNGKIVLRLKMDSRDDERVMLHWQVSDTGKGIAHEEQARLFEPFYQVESATNVVAGTGAGLVHLQAAHALDERRCGWSASRG